MDQRRQLSAILFTDIEGYTAIMQRNEQQAILFRDRHRKVLQQEHQRFNGRIIQFYGDGTLSIFQSVVEGVQCASSMQRQFLQSPQVPVRMGLHMGDIIFNEDHIFGDGVNVASRIESLAVPGCVLISDKANDELHNHPDLKTVSVGVYQFKNVLRTIEVFALDQEGLVKPAANSLQGKIEEKKDPERDKQKNPDTGKSVAINIPVNSIAVLPFVNMSNDPEQEYFGDGMAEEIINSLTHIKDLKVTGRSSSFRFREKGIDLRELGKTLGVRTVLEGSVRKQGKQIRITAQLIDVEAGYHLWSEKYDRNMDDVFAIQDDIALAITKKLKLALLKKERVSITKSYTQNTEAYELYLKGRFYLARRGPSVMTAMQYFQKAIAIDPEFALAHVGYADVNLIIASYGLLPAKQIMAQAKKSAERALELDPTLCEPYCAIGYYYTCSEWNWNEAKKNFQKAIEVNPRYAEGHFRYGWNYLACVEGKFEEAEKHGEMAITLEPFSSICYAHYSLILFYAGKFERALAIGKKGLELDANSFLCYINSGIAYIALQQYDHAISSFEHASKLSNRNYFTIHAFIWIYCLTGHFDKAKILMDEIKERSQREYVADTLTGFSAAYFNDLDEAFNYMEKAYDDRDPLLITIKHGPWVPLAIRNDPRFQKLLDKIGIPE